MSADLSAPVAELRPETRPAPDRRLTALDRPATVAPIPRPRSGKNGQPKRRSSSSLWRLRHYLAPYRARFISMVIFAGLGVAASIVVPLVTKDVIDGPIAQSNRPGLYSLGLFAVALGIIEASLTFGRRWVVAKGTLGTETGIRTELYAKLQRLPMSFHGRWQSGQLLSRIMNDLSTTRRFLGFGALFILMNIVQILVVTGLLLKMYWPLGLVVLASTVPVAALCLRNERAYVKLSRRVQDQTGDVASSVEESAHGLRVIKAFGRADHVFAKFDARSVHLYDTSMARVQLTSKFWTFLEVIPSLTLIIVLGMGAVAAGQHRLTLGSLVAFITLMLSLVWPVCGPRFPALPGTGCDDRSGPDCGDLRRGERNPRGVSWRSRTFAVRSRSMGLGFAFRMPTPTCCTISTSISPPARRSRRWGHRLGQDRPDSAATAALRRHRGVHHHRRRGHP